MIVMRKLYDGKRDEVSDETGLTFVDQFGKPLAIQFVKQSELEGTKIDNILARYAQAGLNPFIDPVQAGQVYGRRITPDEFMESANVVAQATSQFEMMGAEVRARFNNSVSAFLAFAADPDNTLELSHLVTPGVKVDHKGHVLESPGVRVDYAKLKSQAAMPKGHEKKSEENGQSKPAEAGVPK